MDQKSCVPLPCPSADADPCPDLALPCSGSGSISVPSSAEGQRLDRVLADLAAFSIDGWPRMGLRGWRRVCDQGLVSVNGRLAAPGLRVRTGQQIVVRPVAVPADAACTSALPSGSPSDSSSDSSSSDIPHTPHLIGQPSASGLFAAVFKPVGWHSAQLAGGRGASVAAWLATDVGAQAVFTAFAPTIFQYEAPLAVSPNAHGTPQLHGFPQLLNRLDQMTSGLLVVACAAAAPVVWTRLESAGRIDKWYLTVIAGALHRPFVAKQALNTNDRRTTRVLHKATPITRRTAVTPLLTLHAGDVPTLFPGLDPATEMTLALCRIRQGARHQIRAHLAAAGYPLIGDQQYGSPYRVAPLLHHIRLIMPDWQVDCPLPPPCWPSAWLLDELTLGRELLSPADE